MEKCKDCIWNDDYLCDMFGVFVEDDDIACEHWKERLRGTKSRKTI